MSGGGNLLVVDWDYFFVNPLESQLDHGDGSWMLYDWGHNEGIAFLNDAIWTTRKMAFERNGTPLPDVDQRWRQFADRFDLTEECVVAYAESNAFAGSHNEVGDGFDNVVLFDAHHDLYQYDSVEDYLEKCSSDEGVRITCEDWMFWHRHMGSKLWWRFPDWHEVWTHVKEEDDLPIAKAVDLDWDVDDWKRWPFEFTDVFVCRSGNWVPPWCDDQFEEFLGTFDRDVEQVGPNMDMTRNEWKELEGLSW